MVWWVGHTWISYRLQIKLEITWELNFPKLQSQINIEFTHDKEVITTTWGKRCL
jgi:hypothetical protein